MGGMSQLEPATQTKRIYHAHPRYWILALLALTTSVLLLWQLRAGMTWEAAIFATIGLLGGMWALWMATTRIQLTPTALRLLRPIGSTQVDLAQIISVSTQGHFLSVLTVLYHPRQQDGIVATDRVASLLAPGITDAQSLLDQIEERIP